MIYRESKKSDAAEIAKLLERCNSRKVRGKNKYLNDKTYDLLSRYIVAEDDKMHKIVAVAGIIPYSEQSRFEGHEVDWCYCDPAYGGEQLLWKLLEVSRDRFDLGDKPIYCMLWTGFPDLGIENTKLLCALFDLKFRLHKLCFKAYDSVVCKSCRQCKYYDEKSHCICQEDLYVYDKNCRSRDAYEM